jgi:phosphate transport system permease protein
LLFKRSPNSQHHILDHILDRILDRSFGALTLWCGLAIPILLGATASSIGIQAWWAIKSFGLGFITTSDWNVNQNSYGALAQIYGTLTSSAIALLISVPMGLGIALFLTEDFRHIPKALQTLLSFLVELLSAIPSVVYGLWGIFGLVPFLRFLGLPLQGGSLLPASLVLAVMILPTISAICREALLALPVELRLGAMGIGATRWESILYILLPAGRSGIMGAVMLGLGRAMGETMAVTMLIGNRNQIRFSVFEPANTIAAQLATKFAEADGIEVSTLMYAALILFAMTLIVNILANLCISQFDSKFDT